MNEPKLPYPGPSFCGHRLQDGEQGDAWRKLKELYDDSFRAYGPFSVPIVPGYCILMDFEKRLQALEDEYKLRLAMMEQRLKNSG